MAKGDAFNRLEVSSVYVGPGDRYVVSLVVGWSQEQASSMLEAARAALEMTRGPGSEVTHWQVFDRETGETVDLVQQDFDPKKL